MKNKIKHTIQQRTRLDWAIIGGVTLALAGFLLFMTHISPYQPPRDEAIFTVTADSDSPYQRARVVSNESDGKFTAELMDGYEKGLSVNVLVGETDSVGVAKGDTVLVTRDPASNTQTGEIFAFVDQFRLPALGILLAIFVALVAFIGGRRGILSVAGLLVSIMVIGWFMIPRILQGQNVLIITMISAYIIAIVSVIVAHGWRKRTFISVGCICLVLTGVALLAWLATLFTSLTGMTDETAFYIAMGREWLDMRGLIVGGIIIASLGVLDDVVTTQVATVEELHKSNPKMPRTKLFKAASSVGSEHITSLVNTLALAYVGASLPFIIMLMAQSSVPSLITINSQYVATEVVRTLVASIGLVVAVPASTLLATLIYTHSKSRA